MTCCFNRIRPRLESAAAFFLVAVLVSGCATSKPVTQRHFVFPGDTFAYANELVWEYHFDANGKRLVTRREPAPEYKLHCFVVARTARQFFANARFMPSQPKADEETYRQLVRRVARLNPRKPSSDAEKIIIPGYSNLRVFSGAHENLLKAECGGAWQSYLQRGNWRMIFPFTRGGQKSVAEGLLASLKRNWPPLVHVVNFPKLAINHALLVFDAKETESEIRFTAYDPNDMSQPITITFNRAQRRFLFPQTKYFAGGQVNLYEIYSAY